MTWQRILKVAPRTKGLIFNIEFNLINTENDGRYNWEANDELMVYILLVISKAW